ncbi:caspase-6-like [Diadema setosum]|uniref:caspase-6-like n=1 Tax=Diadema setosum TaxID=31175 RepID=UPI003B3A41BA
MDKPEADQALVGDNPTSTDNEESGSTEADARTGVLTTLSAAQNAASRSRERNQETIFQFPGFLESLSRDDTARLLYYNMNHPKRGMALIFNHENFDYQTGMNKRVGTHHDVNNLKHHLARLGFEVLIFQDISAYEIRRQLMNAAKTNHTDSDCFMCVFLTHGDDGIIYGRDQTLELQELFDFFRGENCPTLVGKPKLFLIQACRGEKHEIGVRGFDAVDSAEEESMTVTDSGARPTVPAAADMLLSYSVVQGYYSHRDTAYGSWYVQALAKILSLHGTTMEITEILTLLNQLISQRAVERCLDSRMIGKKQMPCFMSMLTKKLIFTPKKL